METILNQNKKLDDLLKSMKKENKKLKEDKKLRKRPQVKFKAKILQEIFVKFLLRKWS